MLRINRTINENLGPRIYFTIADLSRIFNIEPASARVMASRYNKAGVFVRLKSDMYALASSWSWYGLEQFMRLANIIQVPSYISFLTALSYHGATTQVPRNVFENAALKRSITYRIKDVVFNYYKLKKEYYFGFSLIKNANIFISSREKALVDAIYLSLLGRYRIDMNALDTTHMDRTEIKRILKVYPERVQNIVRNLCRT